MLSVTIDGFALSDGSQYRGIGTYIRHVIDGLARTDDVRVDVLAAADVALPANVIRRPLRRRAPQRWRYAEHDLLLPRDIRRASTALFHSPAQSPPRRVRGPWVQTLHDLTPFVFRHPLLDADRRRWQRIGPRLHDAAAVLCVSRSSADQAMRFLDLPAERLHVAPLGVDSVFTPGAGPCRVDPYLLWVSAWGPHKGLADAVAVHAAVAAAGHPHRLVVAGRQDPWMLDRVHEVVRTSPVAERIDVTGYVDDLVAVYRGATALLMTSRAEGFGLPAVEAMACGAPVVSYDNTSLPEVIGDAGLLVADGDTAAMTQRVLELIGDDELVLDLARRGPARARAFTWQRTIDRHAEVFRAAAGTA